MQTCKGHLNVRACNNISNHVLETFLSWMRKNLPNLTLAQLHEEIDKYILDSSCRFIFF